jgi:hypothetical protein
MYCTHCGKEIPDDAVFCIHCGEKVENQFDDYNFGQDISRDNRAHNNQLIFIIVALLIVVIATGIIIYLIYGKKTVAVTDNDIQEEVTHIIPKGVDKTNKESQDDHSINQQDAWNSVYSDYLEKHYSDEEISFFDLNADERPEMAIFRNGQYELLTISEDNTIDKLSADDCLLTYQQRRNVLCIASWANGHSTDAYYEISNGRWNKFNQAECNVGFDSHAAEPFFNYFVNGNSVDADSYSRCLASGYDNAENIAEQGWVNVRDACAILNDKSNANRYEDYAFQDGDRVENRWEYGCDHSIQVFISPVNGTYEFELVGASGGADGERVINGTAYYDASGAELVGTMQLEAGERIVIIVGGAGGVSQTQAGVVVGGFNGGGDTYWSGGGGGCTDIYTIQGVRVASAAGAGGGNYEVYGEPGRTSDSSPKNLMDGKLGGGTGYTMKESAGAGGGAGWYGGTAGNDDAIGHGGISGYGGDFNRSYENPGHSGVSDDEIDGHVTITRIK